MITEGQIVLSRFPQSGQAEAKLCPALGIRRLPGQYNDWLICMISSQLHQEIPDFDEVITPADSDFRQSGLKSASVLRISRLAVVDSGIFLGKLGQIDSQRLSRIKRRLTNWIQGTQPFIPVDGLQQPLISSLRSLVFALATQHFMTMKLCFLNIKLRFMDIKRRFVNIKLRFHHSWCPLGHGVYRSCL